jgi:hypothetical protein
MIHFLLRPKGIALHSYPTLYDPILLLGHLLPMGLAQRLLFMMEPFRGNSGKFKTYYRNCRSFSQRMRRRYSAQGFNCIEFRNFYGTAYFYAVFPMQWVLDIMYWMIVKLELGLLTSHSIVQLQKKD